MTLGKYFFFIILLFAHFSVGAKSVEVVVNDDFINVHSGPAKEFPIFHVVTLGEKITILKERTNWYRIRVVANNREELKGWISKQDISKLTEVSGQQLIDTKKGFEGYLERDFEVSLYGGRLDDINSLSAGLTWVWTKNLAVDVNYSQAFGETSDINIYSIRMRHTIFPSWKLSPYVALGTGRIRTEPNVNLVQSGDESRTNTHFETGLGFRYFLRDSVLLKMEYRSILALTERDEQERVDQWLIGTSIYF